MASAGTVVITLDANTAKLIDGVKRSEKQIRALRGSVKRAKNTLATIAKTAAGFYAVGKAISFAKSQAEQFVETGAKFEQFESTLKNIEGSSQAASQSMEWIKGFAKDTPYQIDKVTEAYVKLRAYGLDPTKGLLKTLGDTSSAMNKPILQAVEAIADAVTGENERLKEFGIKASKHGEKIAYAWTDASNKTHSVMIKNNRDIIQSTLVAIMNSKYSGAMQDQMHTWNGMVSNMKDSWTNFQADVMKHGVLNYLKAGLETVKTQIATAFDAHSSEAWAKITIVVIDKVIMAAGVARDAFRFLEIGYGVIRTAMLQLGQVFGALYNKAIGFYNSITGSNKAILDLAASQREIDASRAAYMDNIKKANEGAGQQWARDTIANMHKTAKAFEHTTESANETKEKAKETLAAMESGSATAADAVTKVAAAASNAKQTITPYQQAIKEMAMSADDYYSKEMTAITAIEQSDTAMQQATDTATALAQATASIGTAAVDSADGLRKVADGFYILDNSSSSSSRSSGEEDPDIAGWKRRSGAGTTYSVVDPAKLALRNFAQWSDEEAKKQAEAAAKSQEEMQRAAEKAQRESQRRAEAAQREAQRRAQEAERALARRREENIRALERVTRAVDQFRDHLSTISQSLATDYATRARSALYGGTDKGLTFAEATAAARSAWSAFDADHTDEDLLSAYNTRMDELMGTLDQFRDASRYESRAQQNWAKAVAMHQVRTFQKGQSEAKSDVDRQIEKLQQLIESTNAVKSSTDATKLSVDSVKSATDLVKNATNAVKSSTDGVKSHTSSIKSSTATTAGKHQSKATGYHDEWVQTGYETRTVSHQEIYVNENGHDETRWLNEDQIVPTYASKRLYQQIPKFRTGGYTGDFSPDQAVGIVHGREYVVNAETTRDLGLNGSQGLFQQMVAKLSNMEQALAAIARHAGLSAAELRSLIAYEEAKAIVGDYTEVVA